MRTRTPSSVASNASIRTSSSSSSTWLRSRGPEGRGLLESSSCVRGAADWPSLMVSREVAEPGSRIAGRVGMVAPGAETGAGLGDRGRCGRFAGCPERAVAFRTVLAGRRAPVALRLGVVARFAGFRRDLASDLPALFALALVCLLGGRLEELTPELPDLAVWARQGPERYNRPPGRRG